jgi:hypothetical protein
MKFALRTPRLTEQIFRALKVGSDMKIALCYSKNFVLYLATIIMCMLFLYHKQTTINIVVYICIACVSWFSDPFLVGYD